MAMNGWTIHLPLRHLQCLLVLMDLLCATWMLPGNHFTTPYQDIHSLYYHAWWVHSLMWLNYVLIIACGLVITCYGLSNQISVIYLGPCLTYLTSHTSRHFDDVADWVGDMMMMYTITARIRRITHYSIYKISWLFFSSKPTWNIWRLHLCVRICYFSLFYIIVN